ncbi:hypothetical protein BHK98_05895 [Hornefia porci]|uniref:Uncharacterized protein n=1 Tax=Hornefia porci TaxID=2652292 RepID=A0A1Q9JHF5_9FIRM|nr:hypothetical protein [Hornefia porci]OLR55636.1 hypothetical protein BHK98_05895 [Hornefia porci]
MQEISSKVTLLRVTAIVLDVIMLLYFALYFYWMFGVADMDTHPLTRMFATINPMTWGTYFLGLAVLVHFMAFRNIVGRCLLIVPYFLAVLVSLIAVMGMTGWKDLAIYIPHVVVVLLGVVIIRRQYKEKG